MMKWKEVAPCFVLQVILFDPNKISFVVSTIFYNCGQTAVTYRGLHLKENYLTFDVVRESSAKFCLHAGNMEFL